MKNNLLKILCVSGALGSTFLMENYGAIPASSSEDDLKENVIPGGKGVRWCPKPTHGGYCEEKTRTMIVTNPEGRTFLFQVREDERIGELRAMLVGSRFVTSSDFRLLYRGQEVLSNGAAKIGDEGDYLVEGDSKYTIEYITLKILKAKNSMGE